MSIKNAKIIGWIISLAALAAAFIIIGRDAIFGDALLSETDFTFFFIVLVPVVAINVVIGFTKKDKK